MGEECPIYITNIPNSFVYDILKKCHRPISFVYDIIKGVNMIVKKTLNLNKFNHL